MCVARGTYPPLPPPFLPPSPPVNPDHVLKKKEEETMTVEFLQEKKRASCIGSTVGGRVATAKGGGSEACPRTRNF